MTFATLWPSSLIGISVRCLTRDSPNWLLAALLWFSILFVDLNWRYRITVDADTEHGGISVKGSVYLCVMAHRSLLQLAAQRSPATARTTGKQATANTIIPAP